MTVTLRVASPRIPAPRRAAKRRVRRGRSVRDGPRGRVGGGARAAPPRAGRRGRAGVRAAGCSRRRTLAVASSTAAGIARGVAIRVIGGRHAGGGPTGPLRLPSAPASATQRGILVIHPDDCPSNLRFLELLGHPEISARIQVVRVASPVREGMGGLRDRLPRHLRDRPIVALGAGDRRAIGRLGYRFGPLLLLYDERARLRSIEPAPESPIELMRLGRRLRAGQAPA